MKLWIKIALVLVLIGIIVALLVFKFIINKPHQDYEKATPDYTLNAGALYDECKTNKENSNKLYSGKIIEITGKLTRVESVDTLTIAVFSFEQDMFGEKGIRCTMSKKQSTDAKKLKPDGIVRIKGYCTGYNGTDVIIEHCSLVY